MHPRKHGSCNSLGLSRRSQQLFSCPFDCDDDIRLSAPSFKAPHDTGKYRDPPRSGTRQSRLFAIVEKHRVSPKHHVEVLTFFWVSLRESVEKQD